MGTYLERLCIFICLGDLLGNFLPSPKFEKLYHAMAGVLVLLVLLHPLGKNIAKNMENQESRQWAAFEERTLGQKDLWNVEAGTESIRKETEKIMEDYLAGLTEEELEEELEQYGYEKAEEKQDEEGEAWKSGKSSAPE